MKRVTLDVSDAWIDDSIATLVVVGTTLVVVGTSIYVPAKDVVSIEDAPMPLPTKPGERFWGQGYGTDPQWWFVASLSPVDLVYVAADYTVANVHQADVSAAQLVRLPEPEDAS